MTSPSPAVVLGRFPPPLDGQALATERTAELIEANRPVVRVSTTAAERGETVRAAPRWDWGRAAHYLSLRRTIRQRLREAPGAPVLWASISPHPLGHARDLLATLPAIAPDHPVAAVIHRGDFASVFSSPWTRATARRLVSRLDAVVFLTQALADACADAIPEAKRVVIPNTIGSDLVPPSGQVERARRRRAERCRKGASVRLLYLGGMIPSKGYGDVLEGAACLRDRGTPVHLAFVGRWPSAEAEAAFRARVGALGLTAETDVLGSIHDRGRISTLLSDADLLVFPTTYLAEAQPLVVLEAFAAGTPVVVTPHAGLPEMVEEGKQGVFARPHDPASIADAVSRALALWPTLSEGARSRFETVYSPDAVRARWLALLDRLDATP